MARRARKSKGGVVYLVSNRSNEATDVFHAEEDYSAFLDAMRLANEKIPMRLLGYVMMPNHIHFLLWPRRDGDLSRWVQRILTAHVRRHHQQYQTTGRIWQKRFKTFPVQPDEHCLGVQRYVERNALRSGLVERSQDWKWSSLKPLASHRPAELLTEGPLPKPPRWTQLVNAEDDPAELEAIRQSVVSGKPYGDAKWQQKIAKRLDMLSALRPRLRPLQSEE